MFNSIGLLRYFSFPLLIIITISSKDNREDLNGCKHYSYLRLNSVCSCLIRLIHLISWLNQCIYPFQISPFEYTNLQTNYLNPTVYILNFIWDFFNYFILLIVNFLIDIGMIVKLRQTLKEKLEKSKEFNTKAQQKKKRVENETAMENTRSMIIWNVSLNLFLKLPATFYSIIYLYYILYKSNPLNFYNHPGFARFFIHICINSYFCNCLFKLADFLQAFR